MWIGVVVARSPMLYLSPGEQLSGFKVVFSELLVEVPFVKHFEPFPMDRETPSSTNIEKVVVDTIPI